MGWLMALAAMATPAADAHLRRGLALLDSGPAEAAYQELMRAFVLDPELVTPEDPRIEAARLAAGTNLKERLAAAATQSIATFTPTTVRTGSTSGATLASAAASAAPIAERPPPKPRGLLAKGRLTFGAYGFWMVGESRGGVAPELAFGAALGPLRLGGVASLHVADTLAVTVAARLSTTSASRVSYLGAADVGVYFGGPHGVFAPFVNAHVLGLRLNLGAVGFEFHIASLAVYWMGARSWQICPSSGIAVLM